MKEGGAPRGGEGGGGCTCGGGTLEAGGGRLSVQPRDDWDADEGCTSAVPALPLLRCFLENTDLKVDIIPFFCFSWMATGRPMSTTMSSSPLGVTCSEGPLSVSGCPYVGLRRPRRRRRKIHSSMAADKADRMDCVAQPVGLGADVFTDCMLPASALSCLGNCKTTTRGAS